MGGGQGRWRDLASAPSVVSNVNLSSIVSETWVGDRQ